MDACMPCKNLVSSRGFQNMLASVSKDPSPNTPFRHLNWTQLETKLRDTIKELQLERKKVWLFVERTSHILIIIHRMVYLLSGFNG